MITLSQARKALILTNDKLINAKAALKAMTNDPLAHFEDEITTSYDEMLNECYNDKLQEIDFLSCHDANDLMKEHDPVAYRCGLNDFADSFDVSHFDKYTDLESEIEQLENEIEGLESEIEELENEE